MRHRVAKVRQIFEYGFRGPLRPLGRDGNIVDAVLRKHGLARVPFKPLILYPALVDRISKEKLQTGFVPYRQYVFTLPKLLRHFFARRREWLGELCRIAERLLSRAYAEALPGGRPALIVFVQTFGDLVNFNPHLHVLAADGAFLPNGHFVALPRVPGTLLAEGFRRAVLDFLVHNEALSKELRGRMLAWRYSGFSAHNEVSVAAEDAEGRKKLAGYMLRAPMSLQKMTYDAATGTVIYRSKMHAGLKRNFQVMPGAEWLELLCKHIPDRYEHLVRYVGWYSNRARGERAKKACLPAGVALPSPGEESATEFAARARAAWARLIRKVYEADPLECPQCKGPMRIIALIEDPGVIRRILEHLGQWAPLATERSPPPGPTARSLDQWAYRNGVTLKLIQPGKPTQNGPVLLTTFLTSYCSGKAIIPT